MPQSAEPQKTTDYENLFYACRSCNIRKAATKLPAVALTAETVKVFPDGEIRGRSAEAEIIIHELGLDEPKTVEWRHTWIQIIELARQHSREQFTRLMGFPDDLPDLSRLSPSENFKPKGIQQSFFSKRQRGELPITYLF